MKKHEYTVDGGQVVVAENDNVKAVRSLSYNYDFDKMTGFFRRWGKTMEDDPTFSPAGPELLDIEISIDGCPDRCRFCYKNNRSTPATNMSFDTFKLIIDKMPHREDKVVVLELENGKTLEIDADCLVLLSSGRNKSATDILRGDNLAGFYKGDELILLE
jgi:hypothetical protein